MKIENKYMRKLQAAFEDYKGDTEMAHGAYDDILCELITELGCGKVADYFNSLDRWYA